MKEYPLYTKAAADLCVSARYVGGTSKWLCECPFPSKCFGLKWANRPVTPKQ